jgi:nitronate monooxygenase
VAAGGIADRRGVAAAIALGASGVWVGTRFLLAEEANIHPVYRERVRQARGDATLYSQVFDIGWPDAPMRTLKNETTDAWVDAGRPLAPNRPHEGTVVGRRADGSGIPRYFFGSPGRDVTGNVDAMALYAGQGVGLVNRLESAADIVRDLAAGLPHHEEGANTGD